MPMSLKVMLKKFVHKGQITQEEYDALIKKLEGHDKEIRNKAVDEFAEKLKAELLLSKNVISERRKMCESGSHMEGIYSSAIGTLNGVYSMVDEVAEELKEE